jgi:hypothetical protein
MQASIAAKRSNKVLMPSPSNTRFLIKTQQISPLTASGVKNVIGRHGLNLETFYLYSLL